MKNHEKFSLYYQKSIIWPSQLFLPPSRWHSPPHLTAMPTSNSNSPPLPIWPPRPDRVCLLPNERTTPNLIYSIGTPNTNPVRNTLSNTHNRADPSKPSPPSSTSDSPIKIPSTLSRVNPLEQTIPATASSPAPHSPLSNHTHPSHWFRIFGASSSRALISREFYTGFSGMIGLRVWGLYMSRNEGITSLRQRVVGGLR